MDFCPISSPSKPAMNCLIAVVFAVPGPPTKSACLSTDVTAPSSASRRTESSVGMMSCANLGVSSSCGNSHSGTRLSQCAHSLESSSRKYSKNVSDADIVGADAPPSSCILFESFGRSDACSIPPSDHVTQYRNIFS